MTFKFGPQSATVYSTFVLVLAFSSPGLRWVITRSFRLERKRASSRCFAS